jgi:hypothetical protein
MRNAHENRMTVVLKTGRAVLGTSVSYPDDGLLGEAFALPLSLRLTQG